jgi:NADPH:quinone reductase-like Zn-dependent oxidoreductase
MNTIHPETTMKALVLKDYGSTDQLSFEEFTKPEITHPLDIIIKVHAAGVNPAGIG